MPPEELLSSPPSTAAACDYDVIVVGAGAAGLVAAARAAERGRRTLLLEKNRKPGVKILMSGGTRCNLTHDTDRRGIVDAYGKQGRFLHSALAALGPKELIALVEQEGVPTKIEETGKVFPASDTAVDVLGAFMSRLRRSGAELVLEEPVREVEVLDVSAGPRFRIVTSARTLTTNRLIVTTGGQSYPGSGTTGDAYAWAARLGHSIVTPRPALVPITSPAAWVAELKGVTLTDVELRVTQPAGSEPDAKGRAAKPKLLDRRRGSLLFAHFGLTGPVALDISREVSGHAHPATLLLECDFAPNLSDAACDEHLRQQAAEMGKKQVFSILPEAIPRRLAEVLLARAEVKGDQQASQLSKADRSRLVQMFKHLVIPISGTRGFAKAEVTAGGIALDEVDSSTLESKLVSGLFLAGEVLDLDGPIGGYNFQAAFSTGWLAGESV